MFNARDHHVLVKGLLPEPEEDKDRPALTRELSRQLLGQDRARSVYDELFVELNAGDPPDPIAPQAVGHHGPP